jgi:outer membrane protein TolC
MILVTVPASAETPTRWALSEAVAEALVRNPELTAAWRRYEAARQRVTQEHSLPDPMLSAGWNANGNPLPGAGLGTEPTSNIGAMLSQTFPYPGKRDLRATMATRDADAERLQIEAARWGLVARVKQAYYRLAAAYAVGDVLARNKALLDTLLQVSENRYAVGQAAQQDVIKAQTQLSVLELRQQRLDQERVTREGELNALLNRPGGTTVGRPDDLALMPFETSLEALVAAATEHAPMLQRDRVMTDRAHVAVEVAHKDYKPDLTISGGYYYMGAMPSMYEFRFDLNLPLQRDRRAAAVAEQEMTFAAARSTYDATRLALQGRLQEDYLMASTSARLATLYRDTVLPQARFGLESSLASYQTGTVDFLSVLTNFGSVLEYEMSYFDELTAFHTAMSRLEEMTGTSLTH